MPFLLWHMLSLSFDALKYIILQDKLNSAASARWISIIHSQVAERSRIPYGLEPRSSISIEIVTLAIICLKHSKSVIQGACPLEYVSAGMTLHLACEKPSIRSMMQRRLRHMTASKQLDGSDVISAGGLVKGYHTATLNLDKPLEEYLKLEGNLTSGYVLRQQSDSFLSGWCMGTDFGTGCFPVPRVCVERQGTGMFLVNCCELWSGSQAWNYCNFVLMLSTLQGWRSRWPLESETRRIMRSQWWCLPPVWRLTALAWSSYSTERLSRTCSSSRVRLSGCGWNGIRLPLTGGPLALIPVWMLIILQPTGPSCMCWTAPPCKILFALIAWFLGQPARISQYVLSWYACHELALIVLMTLFCFCILRDACIHSSKKNKTSM